MIKVFIKERKARPFWFGHPWVFSGAIDRVKGGPKDGDVVEVCDHEGHTIGEGFWNAKSQIHVRLAALAHEGRLTTDLLVARADRAVDLRLSVLKLPEVTNAFRVVHSEGDGIPGLVVDRIADHLVVQVSCLGLVPHLDAILDRLQERLEPLGILERVSSVAVEEEGLVREGGLLRGEAPPETAEVVEHGLRCRCDVAGGQKTGWYADQRDNRVRFAPLAAGRRVLDAFCYTGAFGLRMLQAGAASVHFLDSSEPALALARAAAEAQALSDRAVFEKQNVLRALDHWAKEGPRFDLVVLDPPKFVRNRAGLVRGLRLYHEVNAKAASVLEPGGLLLTCSCSQHVSDEAFDELLFTVAKEGGLRFQELARGGQSPDHPVLLPLDESRYLKCRLLRRL